MSPESAANADSDREFVLEHTFHAPAAKVFAAYVDPKMIPLWWAPRGGSIRVDVMDVRPGGLWRFIQQLPNGAQQVFSGKYLEVKPVHRLVYTFEVEGQPGGPLTASVDLKETGGATHLRLTNLCATKEERDAMLQYGAAAGAKAAWDGLADLLRRA